MQIENPFNIRLVSGISSAMDRIFFTLTWVDGDRYASSIYSISDREVRRITHGGSESKPIHLGSALYYLSREADIDNVMKLEEMSEPEVIFRHKQILDYIPFRDGVLTVVSENFKSRRPFVINGLRYKHDSTGLLRKRRTLLFSNSTGTRKMISGSYDVADVRSNGSRIIVSCAHLNDDLGLTDLYELDFENGNMAKLTRGRGSIDSFDVSDGGEVAYIGHRQGAKDWAPKKLYLLEPRLEFNIASTAGSSISTDMFDDSEAKVRWDHGSVFVMGQKGGVTSVFELRQNAIRRVTPENRSVRHFDAAGGKVSYSYSQADIPSVIVSPFGDYDPNSGFRGKSADNIWAGSIEGWVIFSGESSPSILFIHGGPHSAFGPVYTIEMQYFSSRGYNILYCNPRGSTGYGESFVKGSIGDWGGEDSRDIMGFLASARKQYGLTGKTGIKGISYGGYMVNWLVTQTWEFDAAVSEKGVSNLLSSVGTSDIGYWFDGPEEIGSSDPWSADSISKFMERSPISYVKNVRTPTLLIHGEEDHRCPIEQSEQFFTALKFYGVDTVFVRLQGESHELANRENPLNRMDALLLKLEWFDRYLKGAAKPKIQDQVLPKDSSY